MPSHGCAQYCVAGAAGCQGQPHAQGLRLDLKLSQEEWGDLVGTTRESVNKQLRAWTEEGVISIDHGYIVIHHKHELEKLAGGIVY